MIDGVLVTGATTPLGLALARRLSADPEIGAVLAVGIEDDVEQQSELLRLPKTRYVRTDLSRARELRDLVFGVVAELGIEVIVHASFHRSAEPQPRSRRLHVESTRQLLHLAERHPTLRRFLLISTGEIYRVDSDLPTLLAEDHPIDYSTELAPVLRERMEVDQLACTQMGMSRLEIVVLRLAELWAAGMGGQLYDYALTPVCVRPLGYDPMLNLLSLDDAARAIHLAVRERGSGVYNIPGCDTLPLSELVRRSGKLCVPLPGPLLGPLYRLRQAALGLEFHYPRNVRRLHFTGLLDGEKAARELGYHPEAPVSWR